MNFSNCSPHAIGVCESLVYGPTLFMLQFHRTRGSDCRFANGTARPRHVTP